MVSRLLCKEVFKRIQSNKADVLLITILPRRKTVFWKDYQITIALLVPFFPRGRKAKLCVFSVT